LPLLHNGHVPALLWVRLGPALPAGRMVPAGPAISDGLPARLPHIALTRNNPPQQLLPSRRRLPSLRNHTTGRCCPLRSSGPVLDLKMSICRFIILSAAALAVSVSSTYAGPCSREMTRRCRPACAELAAGWSLPQSVGAMMHRQPTRGSVAAAEKRLASMACGSARLRRR